VVIGAGIGGLSAALDLASRGVRVCVLERASQAGGKLREIEIEGHPVDVGPTVFTMRWVFEQLFADAGLRFAERIGLKPAEVLARHAWSATERLDLYADLERSVEAIGDFAGAAAARRFRDFSRRARHIYETLEGPFLRASCASPHALVGALGPARLLDLWQISPFTTLWRALGTHFTDPRLRQLFGRYATYCGASPFEAPATLMLVAHVEREGVWLVDGGMRRLAVALETAATERGAQFRYRADVCEILGSARGVSGVRLADGEVVPADAVVINADVAAVAAGCFGPLAARAVTARGTAVRSLSALTIALRAQTDGFPLSHHNVFFSADYAAEFDDLFRRRTMPRGPTVYVCAQDRGAGSGDSCEGKERLFCLINAPACGDLRPLSAPEILECQTRAFTHLAHCGLRLRHPTENPQVTTPRDFNELFPATGGALYGRASHGWKASFDRQPARGRIPGIYFAGGSTHPGPGVPMAALSARLAVASLMADWASTGTSPRVATRGGTSMPSATTVDTSSR